MTELPIDVVPGTSPPRFRWRQVVNTPGGAQTVEQDGPLPPSVEGAVAELVATAKRQAREIDGLREQLRAKQPIPQHPPVAKKGK